MLEIIKKTCQSQGAITLDEYINLCLYHSEFGYYRTKNPFGMGGDFITSPQLTSLFSEVIAMFFMAQYQRMTGAQEPKNPFVLLELGSGNGFFIRDFLRTASKFPEIFKNITVFSVEISETLREEQRNLTLAEFENAVDITWANNVSDAIAEIKESFHSHQPFIALFANEFFDAFAPKQFTLHNQNILETVVTLEQDNLTLAKQDANTYKSLLQSFLPTHTSETTKNDIVIELSPAAIATLNEVLSFLKNELSCGLIIDYGFTKNPFMPTVQAVQNHTSVNILHDPGNSDITFLIDFSILKAIAKQHDFTCYEPIEQGAFLKAIGINERLEQALTNEKFSQEKKDLIKIAVERLTATEKMGSLFKALIIEKTQPTNTE
jgi:NADH dehydrogenase [ubiquinone] 1 alpha subcomplex assembly factor 7